MPSPIRIAMWSGPRNISTAMMRSWGNRPDTFVCDEPLYAFFLHRTGLPHPGALEVIASGETDWRAVAAWLTGPIPGGKQIFFQKQMSHHLLPEVQLDWLDQLSHAFLIREPREMLTSLIKILPAPKLEDTGLPQQWQLFSRMQALTGRVPPVIDAKDVLENPKAVLSALCAALEVPFTEQMLSWPAGPRETDGVWAKHWYDAVEKTTSFGKYQPKQDPLPESFAPLLAAAEDIYARLHKVRLTAP